MILNPKEQAVLELIKEDEEYRDYFFGKVSGFKWYNPLKEAGFFEPDKEPKPKLTEEGKHYTIPEWNILKYLEKLSQKVNTEDNKEFISEILKLITGVNKNNLKVKSDFGNHITWWYFIKILVNIPSEYIPIDVLQFCKEWINTKFDNTLVASELT